MGLGAIKGFDRMEQAKGADRGSRDTSSLLGSSESTNKSAQEPENFNGVLKSKTSAKVGKQTSKKSQDDSADLAPQQSQPSPQQQVAAAKTEPNKTEPNKTEVIKTEARSPRVEAKPVSAPSAQPQAQAMKPAAPVAAGAADVAPASEEMQELMNSLEQVAGDELALRHASMQEFLLNMKSEFGIEPQAIVKAFANLSDAELMASPEETAQAVLSQLNLKPEQMPKAERLYSEMLAQTGESALNETMVGVSAGMTMKVMSEQDVAFEKLQKSITNLNDSFAVRAPAVSNDGKALAGAAFAGAAVTVASAPVVARQAPIAAKSGLEASLQEIARVDQAPVQADLANAMADVAVDTNAAKPEAANEGKDSSKFASLSAALGGLVASAKAAADNASNGSGGENRGEQKSTKAVDTDVKTKSFDSIESALAAVGGNPAPVGEKAAVPLMAGSATAAGLAAGMMKQGQAEAPTNMQDIVRQAQILMKNGGGEMKMQLKPEGIGDVHLKVSVKDGQVGVQMLTETDTAKKAIETGLDDLKTSLAQHKLHVDALKIEVGTDLAKQRFEQSQQDAQREAAREQMKQNAQDFMSSFRQDRQDFRQGFAGDSAFRSYQQPRRPTLPETEPISASGASGSKKASSDRRLDLVA